MAAQSEPNKPKLAQVCADLTHQIRMNCGTDLDQFWFIRLPLVRHLAMLLCSKTVVPVSHRWIPFPL